MYCVLCSCRCCVPLFLYTPCFTVKQSLDLAAPAVAVAVGAVSVGVVVGVLLVLLLRVLLVEVEVAVGGHMVVGQVLLLIAQASGSTGEGGAGLLLLLEGLCGEGVVGGGSGGTGLGVQGSAARHLHRRRHILHTL